MMAATAAFAQIGPWASGYIYTVAGDGYINPYNQMGGFSGDGGPATSAELNLPSDVTVDGAGNIYIADSSNRRIRKVDAATGIITTFAGNGSLGFSGDGGPAIDAGIGAPVGVVADAAGNIYISDVVNDRIRKVDVATGIISTYAGNGSQVGGGDGGPATKAGIANPQGIAMDASGNLYIAETNGYLSGSVLIHTDQQIRKVDAATGIITTVAGNGTYGTSGDGGPATSAEIEGPDAVAVDGAGNLYFTEIGDPRVRKVDASTGIITNVAGNGTFGNGGDGEPATSAEFTGPYGLAVDAAGDMYISDALNCRVWRVDAVTGIIEPYAGDGGGDNCEGYYGDGGPALGAEMYEPWGLALDAAGNLYIADLGGERIRVVGSEANEPTTMTTLMVSAVELNYGQPLTLTATVTPVGSGTPTGTVSFLNGTASLGIAVLNASGVATLTLTPAGGSYSLTAAYGGSSKYQGSVSNPPIEVIVNPDPTTTVLAASPNPAYWGNTVTFTATVSSSIVTPTGSVSFYEGTTLLATEPLAPDGVATFPTIALSVGSHNITADFVANPDFIASTSNTVVEVITPTDFSISSAPGSQNVYPGLAATFTVTIVPGTGWVLPVALSCTQLPANSTCNFSPATVSGGAWSSTLVVQTTAPSPATTASIFSSKLRVTALAGLLLLILPSRLRRSRKGWPLFLMIFAILAAGTSITACSAPGPLTGGTPVGAETITVTGISNNGVQTLTHTANVTLNVNSLF
jgi:sugar lactone lactonase YvrE